MSALRAVRVFCLWIGAGLLSGFVLAAGALAQPAPAPDDEPPSPLEHYLVLFDDLGATVAATGTDCDALVTALDAWRSEHGPALADAARALEADPPELDADPALRDAVERRLARTLDALTEATLACAEHDAASAALERLRSSTSVLAAP